MTRRKKFFLWVLALAVLGVVIWVVIHFTTQPQQPHRIVRLGENNFGSYTVSQFSASRMELHSGGSFNIEVILRLNVNDEYVYSPVFVGNGWFERGGGRITFKFIDAWLYINGMGIVRDGTNGLSQVYIGESVSFNVHGRRIAFEDHNGQRYYFRR